MSQRDPTSVDRALQRPRQFGAMPYVQNELKVMLNGRSLVSTNDRMGHFQTETSNLVFLKDISE